MRIQDRLNKLRNKRGFTLVELMIVVAIIGVLAALAIYGVRKYLSNAKTAEARMGVGRLAKDAQLAYEKESVAEGIVTLKGTADIAHKLCSTSTKVPVADADIKNKKYQSTPADWAETPLAGGVAAGWSCLRFSMSDPQYFQYEYETKATGLVPAVVDETYTAHARGDLDGDGTLSDLSIDGKIQSDGTELVLTLAPTISEISPEE
ncbi:MAG: type II secretion system protein [Deltaproteobacteria bacterium]